MAKRIIRTGTTADPTGDSLKNAFTKVNDNFTELYNALGLDADTLNLGAFEFVGSVMTTTDSSAITIDQAVTVTSDLNVGGDVVPQTALGGNLGSAAKPWKSLYVSNNTIYLGGTPLSLNGSGQLTVNGTSVSSTDKLVSDGAEVILFTDGPEPYTVFPATSTDDQLQIAGSEVSAVSGNLSLTSPTDTLIISNGAGIGGGSKLWTFGADGSLTLPGGTDTITSNAGGLDLSILGQDEETVLTVNFSRSGALTVPSAINFNWIGTNTNAGIIGAQADEIFIAGSSNKRVDIAPNDGANGVFKFGTDGSLTIPGDIKSNGNINIDINLSDSTLRRWQFGEDGEITFPDGTSQTTAWTGNATALVNGSYSISAVYNGIEIKAPLTWKENTTDRVTLNYSTLDDHFIIATNVAGVTKAFNFGDNGNFTIPGNITFPDASVQTTAWTGTLTVNDSGLTINGGTGTIYQGPSGALQAGDKKGGVYHATSTSSNGLFTFGMNGSGIMSAAVEGSVFIGTSMPSNNGGVTTAYPGWLVVENGGKFGADVDTLGNVILGKGVFEKFQAKQDATGTVEHDCINGHIFYHTSPDANWTANFTNLNIAVSYATSVTIVIAQGGTGYYPNAVQIGGVGQTINWQGNATPTPSTNRTDVVTFSIINNAGTYTVLGQLTGF